MATVTNVVVNEIITLVIINVKFPATFHNYFDVSTEERQRNVISYVNIGEEWGIQSLFLLFDRILYIMRRVKCMPSEQR